MKRFGRGSRAIPVARDPVARDPVARDPVARDPVARDPVARDPVARDPVVLGLFLALLIPVAGHGGEVPVAPMSPPLARIESGMRGLPQPLVTGEDQRLPAFEDLYSGAWLARYDNRTGKPVLIWGSGLPLVPGYANGLIWPAPPTLDDVEQRVRILLRASPELHGIADRDLRLNRERSGQFDGGRLWFADFDRLVGGLPVYGSRIYARLQGGNLLQLGFDRVFPIAPDLSVPKLSQADALARARATLGGGKNDSVLEGGTLLLWPVVTADGRYQVELVYRLELRRDGEAATWRVLVDAATGEVRELFDANRHTTGRVTGMVYPRTWTDGEVERPFGSQRVVVGTEEVLTDANGDYSAATIAEAHFTMTGLGAPGGGFKVKNSPAGSDAEVMAPAAAVVDLRWEGAVGSNSSPAERNAFYHLNQARNRAMPWIRPTWFSALVEARVNLGPLCDAFWDGSAVNFFSAGGGCSDAAHVADVIYHEWGHGLDQNHGGDFDDAGGEAIGDITAMLGSRDSVYAPGFLDPARPALVGPLADFTAQRDAQKLVRESNIAERCRPSTGCAGNLGYQCHCEGLVLSGAVWDLAQLLTERWGEANAYARVEKMHYIGLPTWLDYPQTFDSWLAIDDDDGNLFNGTPNGCLIYEAFQRHEIARATTVCSSPHVRLALVSHELDDTAGDADRIADPGETLVIDLQILNSGNAAASTAVATVSTGFAGVSIDRATVAFPTVAAGGTVSSHSPGIELTLGAAVGCGARIPLDVLLRDGDSRYLATIDLEVGKRLATYYAEDFEVGAGAWTGNTGSAARGQWVAGTPTVTANDGDVYQPGTAAQGARCFFTGVNSTWDALGTEDVDGGIARAESPEFAIASAERPVLQFQYWFVSARQSAQPDDIFRVFVVDGATAIEVFRETVSHDGWRSASIPLEGVVAVGTSRIRLRFEATDDSAADNFVEAAIDDVRVYDFDCGSASCTFSAAIGVLGPSSLCVGESTLLQSSVTSCTGTASYQWLKGGSPIPLATGPDYVVSPGLATGTYSYMLEVGCSSEPGCTVRRGPIVIEVAEAAARIAGPPYVEGCYSNAFSFDGGTSTVTGCVAGAAYQWSLDGLDLAGETASTVSLPPELAPGEHELGLRVACASVPSCGDQASPVVARVIEVEAAVAGDDVQFVCAGTGAWFDGAGSRVVGCPGLTLYQWSLGGSAIPGADGPTYASPPLAEGVHDYRLDVECRSVSSDCASAAAVTIVVPPATIPSLGSGLRGARSGASAVFEWSAAGGLAWHLHRVDRAELLSEIWRLPAVATTTVPTAVDATPAPPGGLWFYQVFGVDCAGGSVP